MDIQIIILTLVLILIGVVIYLLISQKNKKDENTQNIEINQLKELSLIHI